MQSTREARVLYRRALRSSIDGELREAWRCTCRALELDMRNVEVNVLAGDLWLNEWLEIGYPDHSETEAAETALAYYEKALSERPHDANAWAGKTHALLRLRRLEDALAASRAGLESLPRRVGVFMKDPEVFVRVGEEVYDGAVRALLAVGRRQAAERLLADGLNAFPDSNYLRTLLPDVV